MENGELRIEKLFSFSIIHYRFFSILRFPLFFTLYSLLMKLNLIILLSLLFSLGSGLITGAAYGIYLKREECLDFLFNKSSGDLTQEEIIEITRTLNSPNDNAPEVTNKEEKENLPLKNLNSSPEKNIAETSKKNYVGSKNSNKFYVPDCRFAKRIKEENKVWFETVEEGEKAGRTFVEC